MKQTNYKKSFNSLKGLFLTGLVLLSTSLLGQVYDIQYSALDFSANKVVSSFNNNNANPGKLLYSNIMASQISGIPTIDCIVTDLGSTSGSTTLNTFDVSSSNNSWFRPQITTTNNGRRFRFEFGFYDNGVFKPYVLENVILNIYDIDAASNGREVVSVETDYSQYETFGNGSSLINNNTTRTSPETFDFATLSNNNTTTITDNSNRVRLTFNSLSELTLSFGEVSKSKSSTETYNIAFELGSGNLNTGTVVANNSIQVDLNNSTSGLNNVVTYNNCNTLVNLSSSGNTNNITATSTALTNLMFSYNTADIPNNNSEYLVIGSSDINLKPSTSGTTGQVTINSNSTFNYVVTIDNTLGRNTITFSKSNMTLTEAEALLDAMQFKITNCTTPAGSRVFGINATLDLTVDIMSPTVFFVANIPTALPVNVISFTGLSKTEGNQLNWTVAQEVDFSHYEVLRSTNGKEFTKVGEVYPENKSTDMKNYSFLDASVNADLSYYKLNLINENGSSSLSNLVVINRNVVAPVITKLYPNPATTSLLVSLEGVDAEVSTITIQDLSGKIVYSTETSDVATLLNINELNKGMYIVKVANQSGFVSVSRFIKN